MSAMKTEMKHRSYEYYRALSQQSVGLIPTPSFHGDYVLNSICDECFCSEITHAMAASKNDR
jgi:hypothetical protein